MQTKYKITIAVISLATAFAFGRYSVPLSTKEETKTTQAENKSKEADADTINKKHVKTVVVDIIKPDGTKQKTTTTIQDDSTEKKTKVSDSDATSKTSDVSKETKRSGSRLTISALAGTKISFSGPFTPIYGGMVTKDVLGPINVGAFGFSSGLGGISAGLSF